MKKLLSFLLVTLLCLAACTPLPPESPITPEQDSNTPSQDTSAPYGIWENEALILAKMDYDAYDDFLISRQNRHVYDLNTGGSSYLCFDPLCDHVYFREQVCLSSLVSGASFFIISPNESANGPVLYFDGPYPMKNLSGFSTSDRFMCRFDFSTQSLEILAGPFKACGTTWSFDVRTNTIYHTIYHVNEEGKTEIHLYSLDTGSKEWTYLATMPTQAVPAHIQGSRLYFNTLGNVIYELDLNDPEKEVVMLDQRGTIHGEYAYYFDVDTAEDAVVANIPDALSGYELQIGAAESYTDYSADLYRINLVMPNAEPELIMENASTKYNLRYSNGYICAAESEPYLAVTALYDGDKYYTMDDPNAKDDMKLVTLFLPTKTFHIFDVDTLEERVLAFDDVYLNDISIDRSNDRLVFTYSNVSEKAVVKVNNKSGDDTSQSYAVLPFDFETFTGATDADVFVIGNKRP